MQRWQEELTKHPLNTTLKQLQDVLTLEVPIDDPVLDIERARFGKVLNYLSEAINSIDPDVAPIDLLDLIQSQMQNQGLISAAQNLINARDGTLFRELNALINPSLSYILQLGSLSSASVSKSADTNAATTAFEHFARSLDGKRRQLEAVLKQVNEQTVEAANTATMITERVKDSGDDFTARITASISQINTTVASQQSEFAESQARNKKEFLDTLMALQSNANETFKSFVNSEKAAANASRNALEAEYESIINDSRIKHAEILRLYELVAVDSVTGGHKRIADREFEASQKWRGITILGVGLAAVWILYSLFGMKSYPQADHLFWLQIGKSIGLTAILLSFAVYASRQSSLHRLNERRARAFFLQVQAFDPFIASLPDEMKHTLKQTLSARIFTSDETINDKETLESGDFKGLDQLLSFAERFKKVIGK